MAKADLVVQVRKESEVRAEIAEELERVIRPLVDGGTYDCCGCSTYNAILDHALALIRGEQPAG